MKVFLKFYRIRDDLEMIWYHMKSIRKWQQGIFQRKYMYTVSVNLQKKKKRLYISAWMLLISHVKALKKTISRNPLEGLSLWWVYVTVECGHHVPFQRPGWRDRQYPNWPQQFLDLREPWGSKFWSGGFLRGYQSCLGLMPQCNDGIKA